MGKPIDTGKGILFGAFAGIAWGAQFPVAGLILSHMHPVYMTFIRYAIAAMLFALLLYFSEGMKGFRLEGQLWKIVLLGTLAFSGYNGLVFTGQAMAGESGPVLTAVMMGFMPFITALVVWGWKKKRPAPPVVLCMLVGAAGVFMVVTKGEIGVFLSGGKTIGAIILMLTAVVCWSIYTVGGASFGSWSALRYTALTCLFGTMSNLIIIVLGTASGWLHAPAWRDLQQTGWPMAYMAVIAGVAAVMAWNQSNRLITSVNTSLFINLVPIVSILISVVNGYPIRGIEIIGSLLAIAAMIAGNWVGRREAASPASSPRRKSAPTPRPATTIGSRRNDRLP